MYNSSDQNMLLERYVVGCEVKLIERYITEGPTALREEIGLTEDQWRIIFDNLVLENELLKKTVGQAAEFFGECYIKHGMAHVREILDVVDDKYDRVVESVFDLLVIERDGLYFHVMQHLDRYMIAFRARGGDFVRKVLGIWKDKYEDNWAKILNLLLHSACNDFASERNINEGLQYFASLMNGMREHRPVEKSEILKKIG